MQIRWLFWVLLFIGIGACGRAPDSPAPKASDSDLIALGQQLFFEPLLSFDGSMSCQSCHEPKRAFTEPRALSIGVTGELLARNSPSLLYVAAYQKLTWANPVLSSLEAQILVPLFSEAPPEQHIGPREEEIYQQIFTQPQYQKLRAQVESASEGPLPPSERTLVTKALAAYLRSLQPFNSPYDRYLKGDTLGPTERLGFELFTGKAQCQTCHSGPLFNGQQRWGQEWSPNIFRRNGLSDRPKRPEEALGLAEFTLNMDDWNVFRVPSLRNVLLTAPYLHDGSVTELSELLSAYNQAHNLKLIPEELAALEAFLASLSDDLEP